MNNTKSQYTNLAKWNERQVALHTGEMVSDYSEAWRHECEALRILDGFTSKAQRHSHLRGEIDPGTGKVTRKGILQHRGEAEVKRLEATILSIWQARQRAKAAPA